MPRIIVEIEYDTPTDPMWLNPDNVAMALNSYCENTKFKVAWADGGNPWQSAEAVDTAHNTRKLSAAQICPKCGKAFKCPPCWCQECCEKENR